MRRRIRKDRENSIEIGSAVPGIISDILQADTLILFIPIYKLDVLPKKNELLLHILKDFLQQ